MTINGIDLTQLASSLTLTTALIIGVLALVRGWVATRGEVRRLEDALAREQGQTSALQAELRDNAVLLDKFSDAIAGLTASVGTTGRAVEQLAASVTSVLIDRKVNP